MRLARALEGQPFTEYRQITVVDKTGATAVHSGAKVLGKHGVATRTDCAAAGNLLKTPAVPDAMADTFAKNADRHLAERLLRALEAGLAAGGEEGPIHSAGLLVVDKLPSRSSISAAIGTTPIRSPCSENSGPTTPRKCRPMSIVP